VGGADACEAVARDAETAAEVCEVCAFGAQSGQTVARCGDPVLLSGDHADPCDDHAAQSRDHAVASRARVHARRDHVVASRGCWCHRHNDNLADPERGAGDYATGDVDRKAEQCTHKPGTRRPGWIGHSRDPRRDSRQRSLDLGPFPFRWRWDLSLRVSKTIDLFPREGC
jgi:hypothetical protein